MSAASEVASVNSGKREKSSATLRTAFGAAVLLLLTMVPYRTSAQTAAPAQKPQTLTGCVQRGEAVSAYKLVTKDGIWNLGGGEKLKIGKQVDHTVTVSGSVVEKHDTTATETKPTELKGSDPNLRGVFEVARFKVVSNTCTASQF